MSDRRSLLVLGLGNVLLQDDGVGSAAVARLLDGFDVPTGARVLDGGTLGLSLLPYLDDADAVILVDAIRAEGSPGDVVRLEGDEVAPAVATRLSPHQIGVADLLDGVRWLDRYPPHLVLVGLIPQSIDLGVGLSPRVFASMPALIDRVIDEARIVGVAFERRQDPATASSDCGSDVARLVGLAESP